MLEVVSQVWQVALLPSLKVLGILLFLYIFYWRVIDYAHAVWFYGRQGKDVARLCPGHLPFIGNLIQVAQSYLKSRRDKDNFYIMTHVLEWTVPKEDPTTAVCFVTNGAVLSIQNPEVVADLYTRKNKYFDKHPLIKKLSYCLTGESILFAETTQDWKDTRKAISPAFYKGKLEKLTEVAKSAVQTTIDRFEKNLAEAEAAGKSSAEIDIIMEVNTMQSRILLVCAFGKDIADEKVDYWINGRLTQRTVGFSLATTFNDLINRLGAPHIQLFPFLATTYIT